LPTGASQGSYPWRSRPPLSPAVGPGPPPPLPEDTRVVFSFNPRPGRVTSLDRVGSELNFSKSWDLGFGPGPAVTLVDFTPSGASRQPFFGRFVRVIAPVPAGFPDFHRTAAGHHLLFEGPSLGYLTANRFSVRPGMLPPGSLGVNPFFSGSSPRAAFHRRGRYSPALGILPPFPGPRQPLFYRWFPVLGRALACRRGHPLRPPVLLPRRTGRRASRGAPRRFGTTSGLYHWRRYLSTSFFGSLVPGW
jgi:hypothetical protein